MDSRTGTNVDATLSADANAPAVGRHSLAGMSGNLQPEILFRLRMLISDALSNRVLEQSVDGGGGQVRLELVRDARQVRGRITDVGRSDSPELALQPVHAGMLEALSDRWGTGRDSDGSVEIWFELGVDSVRSEAEYAQRFERGMRATDGLRGSHETRP